MTARAKLQQRALRVQLDGFVLVRNDHGRAIVNVDEVGPLALKADLDSALGRLGNFLACDPAGKLDVLDSQIFFRDAVFRLLGRVGRVEEAQRPHLLLGGVGRRREWVFLLLFLHLLELGFDLLLLQLSRRLLRHHFIRRALRLFLLLCNRGEHLANTRLARANLRGQRAPSLLLARLARAVPLPK